MIRNSIFLASLVTLIGACGSAQQDSAVKLSGGKTTEDYKSTLVYKMPLGGRCTGTKVSDRFVMTAAHCVTTKKGQPKPELVENAEVALSNFANRDATDTSLWHKGKVKTIHVYHQYATECATAGIDCSLALTPSYLPAPDLALIEFKSNLPAQWPSAQVDRNYVWEGDSVAIVGYGCENGLYGSRTSKVRKKVGLMQVINGYEINTPNRAVSDANLPDFVARFFLTPGAHYGMQSSIDGASLCPGDSGGPVYRAGTNQIVGVHADYTFYDAQDGYTWSNIHTRLVDPWMNIDLLPWLEARLPSTSFVN